MNGLVDAHHAIIIAHALNVDLESVGLGSWQVEDIGLAFLLVRFPLESASNHSNAVVDPIKPHLSVEAIETKPNAVGSMPLLDSYGIDARFLGNLPGRTVLKCPKPEGLHETLDGALQNAFKACGSEPPEGDAAPDFLIVRNLRLAKTLRLPQLQAAMPRRTKIYAVGSSLHLPLSDWGLRPIWTAGGVVTFSPTFILRSPKAFSEVMKIVRSSETWGAYVLPSVIEWADESWGTQACVFSVTLRREDADNITGVVPLRPRPLITCLARCSSITTYSKFQGPRRRQVAVWRYPAHHHRVICPQLVRGG